MRGGTCHGVIESLRRALLYGAPCGALGVLLFRDPTLFLLHHVARVMPRAAFSIAPGPYGLPVVVWLALLGAAGGVGLALLLRLTRLPDLAIGAAAGVAAAYFVPQHLPRGIPPWVLPLAGAAWGWGTVFLMRPLALRGRG